MDKLNLLLKIDVETQKVIANVFILTTGFFSIVFIIFATVIFDKPCLDARAKANVPEIEFLHNQCNGMDTYKAMISILDEHHIEMWMDAILPIHTTVEVHNLSKVEKDGRYVPGTAFDLFPSPTEAAHGAGTISFKMKVLDRALMPNLQEVTRTVIPFAYIRENTFTEPIKSFVKMMAFFLKWFYHLWYLAIFQGVCLLLTGATVLFIYSMRRRDRIENTDSSEQNGKIFFKRENSSRPGDSENPTSNGKTENGNENENYKNSNDGTAEETPVG